MPPRISFAIFARIEWLGTKTLLVDPFKDFALGESDIGLDSNIWDEASLDVTIDCLNTDFQQLLQILCC